MNDHQAVAQGAARLLRLFGESVGRWSPQPHQIPPSPRPYGWLLMAGRGAGKTDADANYVVRHVQGPPCLPGPTPHWIGIIAPTLGDAATSCFSGPSGIFAHDPTARMVNGPGGLSVKWPNGSEAKLFGAHSPEDVERLRSGGNRCLVWMEELAAWRYLDAAWHNMRFGLRVGPHPHWIASTTPKPRPLIKKLAQGKIKNVVVTRASMYDNPHLPEDIKSALEEAYSGTTLGAQELLGQLIDQDENALWTREMIESARLRPEDVPDLIRRCIGVDPSGGAGEQGIVAAGKTGLWAPNGGIKPMHHGIVLGDWTCHMSPDGWGKRAVKAAVEYEADEILVEVNFGGDMAMSTIRSAAEALGVPIPIRKITASRGKAVRAQPVSAITAQGRWHHAGTFTELEDQMCTWTPESDWSPDRIDAAVWTAHRMKIVHTMSTGVGQFGGALASKQLMPGSRS